MHAHRIIILALAIACSPLVAAEPAAPSVETTPPSTQAPASADAQPLDPLHAEKGARALKLFEEHVGALLVERCLDCHGGAATESDFDLSTREALLRGGYAGPAIVPGRADESLLMKLVRHQEEPHMPLEQSRLEDAELQYLAEWINLGALYERPLVAPDAEVVPWTATAIDPKAREHWSYRPLRSPEPPEVSHRDWPRTPIDRFILARLEAEMLQPSAPADRRTWIRRAYFDLVGLPPTPEEVEAFVADRSANAYEKVIDRLLASPRYGERWARHWLDVARFAESHGFEHDYDRPTAYHYRDFVIKALNDDLPYDEFVRWQLAGDELAPDEPLAMMATGFLAAGVHSTQITANEVEKHRYDEMDDMLNTTATAMLGLTVGCARCHDHKYDAIPQRDYYQLLSAFTTTIRSEVDLNLDAAGYQRRKEAFDREHAPYEEALAAFERDELPARFAAWDAARSEPLPPWTVLDLTGYKSTGKATFEELEDGSVLVSGANALKDTYTLVADVQASGITAVRLEALAHASLARRGPGRAGNGNFALSDIQLTAAPLNGEGKPEPVTARFASARATFEQKKFAVAGAIDDGSLGSTAWAVDPQFGRDHAAVFELAEPIGFEGGTRLTFTLKFMENIHHGIGRPRLAITTAASPGEVAIDAPHVSQAVLTLLELPPADRTAEQTNSLRRWYATVDSQWQKLDRARRQHLREAPKPPIVKALVCSEGLEPLRLHSQGKEFFEQTYFLRRGDTEAKDGEAALGFLQVLQRGDDASAWMLDAPQESRTSWRRASLATWMTDVEHGAGNLLARVIVNRLWQHHLGRGIVATPSDFGTRGDPPTHPELLDWLAAELVREGWRLKPLHKQMMLSAVYRQSSAGNTAMASIDPENLLCWHYRSHRLEAEVIRDAMLAAGGLLDETMYGPGTLADDHRRRSIYFTVKRSEIPTMMQVFDAPDALQGIGERPTTTVAPQALYLMNSPQARDCAKGLAQRAAQSGDLKRSIEQAYLIAMARRPSKQETSDALEFLKEQTASYEQAGSESAQQQAFSDFCQVLLGLNEFVYVQ